MNKLARDQGGMNRMNQQPTFDMNLSQQYMPGMLPQQLQQNQMAMTQQMMNNMLA